MSNTQQNHGCRLTISSDTKCNDRDFSLPKNRNVRVKEEEKVEEDRTEQKKIGRDRKRQNNNRISQFAAEQHIIINE